MLPVWAFNEETSWAEQVSQIATVLSPEAVAIMPSPCHSHAHWLMNMITACQKLTGNRPCLPDITVERLRYSIVNALCAGHDVAMTWGLRVEAGWTVQKGGGGGYHEPLKIKDGILMCNPLCIWTEMGQKRWQLMFSVHDCYEPFLVSDCKQLTATDRLQSQLPCKGYHANSMPTKACSEIVFTQNWFEHCT